MNLHFAPNHLSGPSEVFFIVRGAVQKCRPAWLADDENIKKHWLKHSKTGPTPQKNEIKKIYI